MTILTKMVDFARSTTYEQIPEEIRRTSITALTDSLGCLISGSGTEGADAVCRYLQARPQRPDAVIPCRGFYAQMDEAALAWSLFAHAQDFDNCSCFLGHGSSVLAPVVLILGQKYHKTGREVMRAYILGMECGFQLAKSMVPETSFRGFHGTSVFGGITSAVASSLLLGLSRADTETAVALACTHGAGLMVNFGTMTKFYHAGMAASNGIRCAQLAQAGMKAAPLPFEGVSGFVQAFSGKVLTAGDLPFGNPWVLQTDSLLVKLFPCCSAAHSSLCALRDLMEEHGLTDGDITEVLTQVPLYSTHCLKYPDPSDEAQCRFSMEFALANMLIHGRYDLTSFHQENIKNTSIRTAMKKVRMEVSGEFPDFLDAEPAIVTVRLTDGKHFTRRLDYPQGRTLESPCTRLQLWEKFSCCTKDTLSTDNAARLFQMLCGLEEVEDIATLMKLL